MLLTPKPEKLSLYMWYKSKNVTKLMLNYCNDHGPKSVFHIQVLKLTNGSENSNIEISLTYIHFEV
jgi:hypothetical protein